MVREEGADFGVGAVPTGEAPALPLMSPPLFPSGSSRLGDPATFSASQGGPLLLSSGL